MEVNKIFKPKKFDNFTIVPNAVFRIKGISIGATGLYAYLFSHDTKRPITIKYIEQHFKESYKAITARIKELEKHNLLTREEVRTAGKFAGYNYYLTDSQNAKRQKAKENNINNIYSYDESTKAYKALQHFIDLFPEKYQPKTQAAKYKWYQTLDKIERIDNYNLSDVYKICLHLRSDAFWATNFLSLLKLRNKDKNDIRYIDRFMDKYNRITLPNCYYKVKGILDYYTYEDDGEVLLGARTHSGHLNAYNLKNILNYAEYDIMLKYAITNKK